MRKKPALGTILLTAAVTLYACGIIPNADTSIVTVTIGDTPQHAQLRAEAATPWLRLKHALARVRLISEANAYIPSVVQVIIVTVTAADITTPIVAVHTVGAGDTTAEIRIEVENGTDRRFVVEGYYTPVSQPTQLSYRGEVVTSLGGGEVTLPVDMLFAGQAIYVSPVGDDTLNTGLSAASPFATITKALNSQATTTPYTTIPVIAVSAGTYTADAGFGGGETLPLQLNPGTLLLCTGMNGSTVIDDAGTISQAAAVIMGAAGSRVEGCRIESLTPVLGAAIDDAGTSMVVDSCTIANDPGSLIWRRYGVVISGNTTVKDSLFTGMVNDLVGAGVSILSGTSLVAGNSFTQCENGVMQSGGESSIEQNVMSENMRAGIYVYGGIAWISGNALSCNAAADLETSVTYTIDATGNAWDHPSPTVEMRPAGPPYACTAGIDICYSGSIPLYSNPSAAVPGGCP